MSLNSSMARSFEDLVVLASRGGQEARVLSRDECLAATREYVHQARERLKDRHRVGESGANVVHDLSAMVDHMLDGVMTLAMGSLGIPKASTVHLCLIALGGYGRAELSPGSDLDICLVHDNKADAHLKALSGFLVPFLWDTGFAIGFATHTLKDVRTLMREDEKAFTSYLESRLLWGESKVYARLCLLVEEAAAPGGTKEYVRAKLRERLSALPAVEGDVFNPEPNIKENAGGLRDYHIALWVLRVALGVRNLDDLAARGCISPEQQIQTAAAMDFLWRVRNELHFSRGTNDDRLTYDNQRRVAQAFGYESATQSSILLFMQDYYGAASQIRHLLAAVARILDQPGGLPGFPGCAMSAAESVVQDGLLFVGLTDPNYFAHNPVRMLEVYWRAQREHAQLSHHTEEMLRRNLSVVNDEFRTSAMAFRYFQAICGRPRTAGAVLRGMARSGLLGAYIPEFAAIQGVLCFEDFHHYPVDEHTLIAIEALGRINELDGPVGRCLREALDNLADPHILVMGILCHDLGKAAGEIHVEEGMTRAAVFAARMGMPKDDSERMLFIVEHHMLMNTISQYRDTDDEHILRGFALTVKTEQRLRMLFLMSYADLSSVGPNVWTEWKGALLLQLYLRTVQRLLGRVETIGHDFWDSRKAEELRSLAPDNLRPFVDDHIRGLGQRYFMAFTPEKMVSHMQAVEQARRTGLAVVAEELPGGAMTEVVVCTPDRQGLFARLAGAFSSQLFDVSSAAVFTSADGYAIDCFSVFDAKRGAALTPAQVRHLTRVIEEILLGGASVTEYVEKARKRIFALLQPRVPVTARVLFDNESSREHTVIDIESADRTGLLHDITRAMAEAGLDIATARIVTDARRVRDSFYVRKDGGKIIDSAGQEVVRQILLAALHPRPVTET